MGRGYSLDLRERIVARVASGTSRRAAARLFSVSESCAIKLIHRVAATGSAAPARQGRPPGGGKLMAHLGYLTGRVEAQPDITMPELADELKRERGVTAHPASISRILCGAGYTYKKTADGVGARSRRSS
jgi:transposase